MALIFVFFQEALIHLGAKFAPCMRNDKLLNEVLEHEREEEERSGCCIKTDGSGCIQSSPSNCSVRISSVLYFTFSLFDEANH